MRSGNFGLRIPVRRRDQLGDLQRSFNEMSADLQSLDIEATDVAQVRIVVVSVHETPDPPEVRHVAFNEVLLQQRGAPGLDVPVP